MHEFWRAIETNDLETAKRLLEQDASLAGRDFRPPEEQDAHTHGFPLTQACELGDAQMAKLLLNHGADVNAQSPSEDQREFGMPLHHAVVDANYELANLLLDHGASVHGYPYCDKSTVERLYAAAVEAGAPADLVRKGLRQFLGPFSLDIPEDAPAAVRLFDRMLTLGGEVCMSSLLRAGRNDVAEELLRACPDSPATRHDYPPGTVLECLARAASWFGYPEVQRLCMDLCPDRYTVDIARDAIHRAVISHNRDGSWQEYRELIQGQLDFIKEAGLLDAIQNDDSFQPLYLLAENYCWPRNYGHRAGVSTPDGMIAIAQLFLAYGFDDVNFRCPESGMSAVEMAQSREGHPCMKEYVEFLRERGAE